MSSSICISYYETADSLTAYMNVLVTLLDRVEGFCESVGQAILGLGSTTAGATPAAAEVATVLGTITGICGVVSAS